MNRKRPSIPKLAQRILSGIIPHHKRDIILGDFTEHYIRVANKRGITAAFIWYWSQLFASLPSFIHNSTYFGSMMFKNYIIIALRNLRKHKSYSLINISGLAIGIACCIMIFLFVQDELSYDKFHPNADRIYRIVTSTSDDGQPTNANGIYGTGPRLKEYFPEIDDYTRIRTVGQGVKTFVAHEEARLYDDGFFFADSNFFSFFNFPVIEGNPATVLTKPNTIVLTQSTARKYFGEESPIGKVIEADPYHDGQLSNFEVTGVIKDVPDNSHISFNFLASYSSQREDLTYMGGFEQNFTYIMLYDKGSVDYVNSKMLEFLETTWRNDPWYTISLQPLLDIHLRSNLRSEIGVNGNIAYVYAFSIIALFVLIIACINFMNLATARSTKRAKEVGLRKVIGAHKRQMISQFLGESVIFALLGGILALILLYISLPLFNGLTGKQVALSFFENPIFYLWLPLITITVGLLAGIYPALFLSGFEPVKVLKGNFSFSKSGTRLRKGLVVFQFSISIFLIAATAVTLKQLDFIRKQDLGYASDQIIAIPLNNEMRDGFSGFRDELIQQANILNATTSSHVPTKGSSHNGFRIEGVENGLGLARYLVDRNFLDTYQIELLAGQGLDNDITVDTTNGDFVISALAVQEAGWETEEEALGRQMTWRGRYSGKITGVVNDIHIYSLHNEVYSMAFFITPIERHNYVSIRVKPQDLSNTLAYISETWSTFSPNFPIDYFFLDDSFQKMHETDERLFKVFIIFSLLAVFVASLGLFGLATYSVEQRTKEIGIRKVLGASASGIATMFSIDFLKLVLVANVIAWPITYFLMSKWLESFVYKTEIGLVSFIIAAGLATAIALFTISSQALKAAFSNPIHSLKGE